MSEEDEDHSLKNLAFKNSFFHRLKKFIDTNLYSFYYNLLQNSDDNDFFFTIATIINFIQLIGYSFKDDVIKKKNVHLYLFPVFTIILLNIFYKLLNIFLIFFY